LKVTPVQRISAGTAFKDDGDFSFAHAMQVQAMRPNTEQLSRRRVQLIALPGRPRLVDTSGYNHQQDKNQNRENHAARPNPSGFWSFFV